MSKITVKITKNDAEVALKVTEIQSNSLPDLIASLKAAKSITNSFLSELVDQEKSTNVKQTRKAEIEEENSDDEEDEEESANKKLKT